LPIDDNAAGGNRAGQSRELGIGGVEQIAGEHGQYACQCDSSDKQPQNKA
jgi:hypothetical protein